MKQPPADPAALDAFLAELASGKRRAELHADPMMPTRWQIAYAARIDPDGFGGLLRDAELIGLQVIRDELLDISDDSSEDFVDTERGPRFNAEAVARSKLRIDTRQWLLERLQRELYGAKTDAKVDVTHYVVELPAPVKDTSEWLKQHGQQSQHEIKSVSGALSQVPKPH